VYIIFNTEQDKTGQKLGYRQDGYYESTPWKRTQTIILYLSPG